MRSRRPGRPASRSSISSPDAPRARSRTISTWPSNSKRRCPRGLGNAVWCARHLIGDEPFAVLLVDDLMVGDPPCLKQMIDAYQETGGNLVAVIEVPREETRRYGVLDVVADNGTLVRAKGVVEKPDPAVAPSTLTIIGRYIIQPEIFGHLAA